jgi:DNA-binding transcriptional LysR family regulator
MDLQRTDLNLMVAFEALMAERSVSAAASRLGLSQPAMSGALSRLRIMFNDELFVRAGRAMLPTVRATQLETQIAAALTQLRAALTPPEAFDPASSQRGFTISGGDYAAMVILPRLAARLAQAAPSINLRFRFVEKDAIPGLLDTGALDLSLGVYPRAPKRLCLQHLFEERFVCVARSRHPALRAGLTLDAFVKLPHLLVTERGDAHGAVDEALAKQGLARRIKLTVPHVLVVPLVFPGSDMIATVGARAGRTFARSGSIDVFEPPLDLQPWRLSMLWARQKAGDLGLAWLRGELTRVSKEESASF